jgi:tetratricopeptide (TPR) repeat protein
MAFCRLGWTQDPLADLYKNAGNAADQKVAQRYFPAIQKCGNALADKSKTTSAANLCKQAAKIAQEFSPNARLVEKLDAFGWAAYALAQNGELKEALVWANKAVDLAKLVDDERDSSIAYARRGAIEAASGDLTAADQDMTIAEDFDRKAIVWAKQAKFFTHIDDYYRGFIQDLRDHAAILQKMNRPEEAQKKLNEAAEVH